MQLYDVGISKLHNHQGVRARAQAEPGWGLFHCFKYKQILVYLSLVCVLFTWSPLISNQDENFRLPPRRECICIIKVKSLVVSLG